MAKVHQIKGERMRFEADSDKAGHPPYLVDLSENEGEGKCGCRDFEIRIVKNRREKKGKQFCKHLVRSFAFFGWTMAREIAQQTKRK